MNGLTWTAEADAELALLWADKTLSCRQIGERMGPGKNAVVGRAHRLKLPGRESPIPPGKQRTSMKPIAGAAALHLAKAVQVACPVVAAPPRPVLRASAPSPIRACQWIEGEPRGVASAFCGAPVLRGRSWCAEHHALCFRPIPVRAA